MFQVRFHGRGGQGVVTAAEMLSVAAFREGKHAQAFPSFGSERMGAPVVSFCRIDSKVIRMRDPIYEPDALIIQDPTLLQAPGTFDGLKADGYVLINTGKPLSELKIDAIIARLKPGHIMTIPGTEIAMKHIKRPLPNAVMLGGLAALSGVIKMDSVAEAIAHAFSGKIGEVNIAAAKEAFETVAAAKKEEKIAC